MKPVRTRHGGHDQFDTGWLYIVGYAATQLQVFFVQLSFVQDVFCSDGGATAFWASAVQSSYMPMV